MMLCFDVDVRISFELLCQQLLATLVVIFSIHRGRFESPPTHKTVSHIQTHTHTHSLLPTAASLSLLSPDPPLTRFGS